MAWPQTSPGVLTDYLNEVFDVDQFVKTVDNTVRTLINLRRGTPFDAIAFTGNSGAAMAYPLSYHLQIPLICIRKTTDNSHYVQGGNGELEGYISAEKYLIVDDFTSSGTTLKRILKTMGRDMPRAKCVGIALYTREVSDSRPPFKYMADDMITILQEIPIFGTKDPVQHSRRTKYI